eukprot:5874466-Prymnesium_polylepis.1
MVLGCPRQDMVGFNCVNTSVGISVHHTSPPSTTCRVRERSNTSPGCAPPPAPMPVPPPAPRPPLP